MIEKKPSVLIVDDEPTVCDLLCDHLNERGYPCTAVLNGDDAIAKLDSENFNVVLLDIRMPGMSGMEVLREIWLNHSDIATIMITALDDVETAVLAMKWGASDYIVKPFNLDKVEQSMLTALETRSATEKSPTEMDAIAHGVEVQLAPLSSYTKLVTQRTVDIARTLGIAEKEIQRWAATKARRNAKMDRVIKSSTDEPV